MAELKEINDSNYKETLAQEGVHFFYVFASWCGTCRFFAPKYAETAEKHPEINFYKIDGEENKEFSELLNIDNLPYIAAFKGSTLLGGKSTSKIETLENMIEKVKSTL
jgi:thioredoxin reductase (NADPH)